MRVLKPQELVQPTTFQECSKSPLQASSDALYFPPTHTPYLLLASLVSLGHCMASSVASLSIKSLPAFPTKSNNRNNQLLNQMASTTLGFFLPLTLFFFPLLLWLLLDSSTLH